MAAVKQFSAKQKTAMTWWANPKYKEYDAIICDGAVRSGKTLSMGMGFFLWAMRRFNGEQFALCGKTIVSLRRNVLHEILPKVAALGFRCEEKRSENLVIVRSGGRENRFYLFGGYDEGSAALIQGVTLAGVLFDEAALMPRSFVEQASARCSISGSKLWFNCNPEGPMHWFYREWILRAEERGALYLHFTMDDNPSLSPRIRARYEKAYSGTFYRRFILGEWTAANLLKQRKIVICEGCESCLAEIAAYCWEDGGTGRDRPKKERDHAMDEMRYFAVSIAKKEHGGGIAMRAVERAAR